MLVTPFSKFNCAVEHRQSSPKIEPYCGCLPWQLFLSAIAHLFLSESFGSGRLCHQNSARGELSRRPTCGAKWWMRCNGPSQSLPTASSSCFLSKLASPGFLRTMITMAHQKQACPVPHIFYCSCLSKCIASVLISHGGTLMTRTYYYAYILALIYSLNSINNWKSLPFLEPDEVQLNTVRIYGCHQCLRLGGAAYDILALGVPSPEPDVIRTVGAMVRWFRNMVSHELKTSSSQSGVLG